MMTAIFVPIYAKIFHATDTQIGIIVASYGFSLLISSFIFGRASDIYGRRKFIKIGLFFSFLFYLLTILASSPAMLAILRAFSGFFMGVLLAPLMAYTHDSGQKMGNFSSYGALGWAIGGVLGGIIAWLAQGYFTRDLAAIWAVFLFSSLILAVSFAISLGLEKVPAKYIKTPFLPVELVRRDLGVYIPNLLRNLGANAVWVIFPLFLVGMGANFFWIGIIYFANAGAQFFIMRRLDFISSRHLISLGLVVSVLVFFAYTLTTSYFQIIPLQLFLALSFSTVQVGSLIYLTDKNVEKATSVGVLSSFNSMAMAVGPIIGGLISDSFGFSGTMYFASAITLAGLFFHMAFRAGKPTGNQVSP